MPVPVIMDCDPGVDDAVALALALASPEIDLRAVTTVAGNASIGQVTENACALLAHLGRPEIPVAAGAGRQLVHAYRHGVTSPHGANGLGGVDLSPPRVAPCEKSAVELIRDVLASRPGEIGAASGKASNQQEPSRFTILAAGPLTNLALVAASYPELLDRIERVIVMGGTTGKGNITSLAEFNIWCDPEAAHRVFTEPGLDVLLIGLDVTRDARLSAEDVALIAGIGAPRPTSAPSRSNRPSPTSGLPPGRTTGITLAKMLEGYDDHDLRGWAVHDAVIVAALLSPDLLATRPARVEVDTGTGPGRGRTRVMFDDKRPARRNRYTSSGSITLATDLDVNAFRRLVVTRLAPSGCDDW